MRHTEPGIVVTLSREGLRRARADNALLRRARFRETARVWVLALGAVIGWVVVLGLTK
jgi:hypothetical protein